MSDPSKRAFTTEHGKELTLYPEEMCLKGGIGQLLISDTDGIKLSSDGVIQIIGANIRIEAPTVAYTAIHGELVMAKADAMLPTPESSLSMSNYYQLLSGSDTVIEGSDLETFDPYPDQPVVGTFDWGQLALNVLAGLAVVALVAVAVFAVVATGGLAAVGIGAAAAGSMAGAAAVGMVAIGDIASGEVSDTGAYMSAGFSGAVTGAAFAGLGVAGQAFGKAFGASCKIFNAIKYTSFASGGLSLSMAGFDLASLVGGWLFPGNPLTNLNQKLHSNALYNGLQIAVSALAVFTGSAYSTMKLMYRTCFIAGTMILTAAGLVAIETIKAGDKVISTNVETFETAQKSVLESYVRQSWSLVHIWIDGKKTSVTPNHPYWVSEQGWVNAGELTVAEQLRESDGNLRSIQKIEFEKLNVPITVYNFEVEDFHTYYAGEIAILVHNANCKYTVSDDGSIEMTDWGDYPDGYAKPDGSLKIIDGDDYSAAEQLKNAANRNIHATDPAANGMQVHEVHPVKFGGSPTDPGNKIYLSPPDHHRISAWWRSLQYQLTGK